MRILKYQFSTSITDFLDYKQLFFTKIEETLSRWLGNIFCLQLYINYILETSFPELPITGFFIKQQCPYTIESVIPKLIDKTLLTFDMIKLSSNNKSDNAQNLQS